MTKDLYGPPKVGGDTLSYCSRCKMELAHVIVSMMNGRPAKVLCKTCKGQHKYKSSAPIVSPGSGLPKGPRKSTPRATIRVAELWEQKLAEKRASVPKPYSVKDSFVMGDVIEHPQFGLGLVEEVRKGGKITVLFREDQKVLIHELGKPAF